jgi:hypothetical protein
MGKNLFSSQQIQKDMGVSESPYQTIPAILVGKMMMNQ